MQPLAFGWLHDVADCLGFAECDGDGGAGAVLAVVVVVAVAAGVVVVGELGWLDGPAATDAVIVALAGLIHGEV